MHEKNGWAITRADVGGFMELVSEWNGVFCS